MCFANTPGWWNVQGILDGKYDDLTEQAFYMVGGIDEVIAKAEKIAKENAWWRDVTTTLYKLIFLDFSCSPETCSRAGVCQLLLRDPCFCSFLLQFTRNKQLQWHWFSLHNSNTTLGLEKLVPFVMQIRQIMNWFSLLLAKLSCSGFKNGLGVFYVVFGLVSLLNIEK